MVSGRNNHASNANPSPIFNITQKAIEYGRRPRESKLPEKTINLLEKVVQSFFSHS